MEKIKECLKKAAKWYVMNCVFEKGWLQEHSTIFYYELKKISDYVLDNDLEDKVYIL